MAKRYIVRDRYIVMDNVEHSCCYGSCVRDTDQPTEYANKFALVCECHDEEIANMIAGALNKCEFLEGK